MIPFYIIIILNLYKCCYDIKFSGIPKSFITNELLENIILSAGSIRLERADPIMDIDSISVLPQETPMFVEYDDEEESGMDIGNPNDCLMNMISAALSKQQQEGWLSLHQATPKLLYIGLI